MKTIVFKTKLKHKKHSVNNKTRTIDIQATFAKLFQWPVWFSSVFHLFFRDTILNPPDLGFFLIGWTRKAMALYWVWHNADIALRVTLP